MKEPAHSEIFCHPPLPQSLHYHNRPFPLVLCPPSHRPDLQNSTEASHGYLQTHSSTIESLLKSHSVLLLRNFAQSTPEHFATLVSTSLALPNFPYLGGNAVRTAIVGDRVFTTNESPPDKPIPFHHELAQTNRYPKRVLFFCEEEAESGGETPVLYSPAVYEELKERVPEFMNTVERVGIRYSRVMTKEDRPESAIGRGWMKTFKVENRQGVERVLKERGYDWEWIGEGEGAMLRETSPILKAVYEGEDGRKSFFNQVLAVWGGWKDKFNEPERCVFAGDGSGLDGEVMKVVAEVMEGHKVSVPWKKGDILYVDNMMAMHSRARFTGRRRVLASLACENGSE